MCLEVSVGVSKALNSKSHFFAPLEAKALAELEAQRREHEERQAEEGFSEALGF